MAFLIVHHTVEDYDKWKPVFDEHGASRKEFGSRGARVFRSGDNPNEVVAIFEWDSLEGAHKFAESPELREVMQRAGVMSRPDLFFIEEVDQQPS